MRTACGMIVTAIAAAALTGCATNGMSVQPLAGGSLLGGFAGSAGFGGGDHFRAARATEEATPKMAQAPAEQKVQHVVYVGKLPDQLPQTPEDVLSSVDTDEQAADPGLISPMPAPPAEEFPAPAVDEPAEAPMGEPGAAADDQLTPRHVASMLVAGLSPHEVVELFASRGKRMDFSVPGIEAMMDEGVPVETIRELRRLTVERAALPVPALEPAASAR